MFWSWNGATCTKRFPVYKVDFLWDKLILYKRFLLYEANERDLELDFSQFPLISLELSQQQSVTQQTVVVQKKQKTHQLLDSELSNYDSEMVLWTFDLVASSTECTECYTSTTFLPCHPSLLPSFVSASFLPYFRQFFPRGTAAPWACLPACPTARRITDEIEKATGNSPTGASERTNGGQEHEQEEQERERGKSELRPPPLYTVRRPLIRDVCFVCSQKFRLPIGLHSSCSSPTDGGTFQKYF